MDTVEIFINQAIEYKKNGRVREAAEAYSEAFDYLLMEARNFAQKTVGYKDENGTREIPTEYFEAVRTYLRRDENAARISNNGGVLFAQLGDFEVAKKWFGQAIEMHPNGEYPEAQTNLDNLKD